MARIASALAAAAPDAAASRHRARPGSPQVGQAPERSCTPWTQRGSGRRTLLLLRNSFLAVAKAKGALDVAQGAWLRRAQPRDGRACIGSAAAEMSSHDSHHDTPWHQSVHAPGADKRGSSARAAQAERLRQAHVAVHLQKHLKQLKQEVEEEEALSQGPPAPSAAHPSASQPTTGGSAHAGAAATVLQQVKEAARVSPTQEP